jgi:hypothetical protein
MKTPREIFLARHRAAEPKLNQIREAALSAMQERPAANFAAPGPAWRRVVSSLGDWLAVPWRELILSSRRVWTGLVVVWAVIIVVNVAQRDPGTHIHGSTANAPVMMASWREEQRLMNELLADRVTPPAANRPANSAPRPRTQRFGMAAA